MPKHIRPIRIEGNIAYVALTKGYEALIDVDDIPLVAGRHWCATIAHRPDGSIRTVYAVSAFPIEGGRRRLTYLHRLIAGPPDGMHTDHIDGDGLNNRRHNLRHATTAQNNKNLRTSISNTSGVKGVRWCKRDHRWVAQIAVDGRTRTLGYFASIEAAAAAYAAASAELHGEFGRLR